MSFVVFLSCCLMLSVTCAFTDESQINVKPGEDVTLRCQSHRDADIRLLEWIRPDLESDGYVFFYRDNRSYEKYQHPSFRGRVELKDPEMKNGDVSVILKNININDAGNYECQITISNTEPLINSMSLTVSDSVNAAELTLGEGKTEKSITGGGNKDVNVGLVAGLSVVALFLCFIVFIGFIIYKNYKKPTSYQPPA